MLGGSREGGRADGSTLAHTRRACLAHWPQQPRIPAGHFPKRICACETRRVAASSRPVPKIPGRRGEAFVFPCEEESSTPDQLRLLWREQEKLERVRVGQCRSEGIQNNQILPENRHFHKAIMRSRREGSPIIFRCLQGLWGRVLTSRNGLLILRLKAV